MFHGIPYGCELPLDNAGASASSCITVKNEMLIHRDLESGESMQLCPLYHLSGEVPKLYHDCHVFPFSSEFYLYMLHEFYIYFIL
jgi:hypothetical protein